MPQIQPKMVPITQGKPVEIPKAKAAFTDSNMNIKNNTIEMMLKDNSQGAQKKDKVQEDIKKIEDFIDRIQPGQSLGGKEFQMKELIENLRNSVDKLQSKKQPEIREFLKRYQDIYKFIQLVNHNEISFNEFRAQVEIFNKSNANSNFWSRYLAYVNKCQCIINITNLVLTRQVDNTTTLEDHWIKKYKTPSIKFEAVV